MRSSCFYVLALLIASATLGSQGARVAFDVASIREAPAGTIGLPSLRVYEGRVEIFKAPLVRLIALAFDVVPDRVSGPDWLKQGPESTRFEVRATFPKELDRRHLPDMLRTLLAERFGLVSHFDEKATPVYALTLGSGAPKMKRVEAFNALATKFSDDGEKALTDTTATDFTTKSLLQDNEVRTVANVDRVRTITSGSMFEFRFNAGLRTFTHIATRMTMAELASTLISSTDRPVVDRTGLSGHYQFTIDLPGTNAAARVAERIGMTDRNGNPIAGGGDRTSLVRQAVEGLGLRLEAQQLPMKVLVVDAIRQTPTEN